MQAVGVGRDVHARHEGAKVLLVDDLAGGQRHGPDAAAVEAALRSGT